MGRILAATDLRHARPVAIKVLRTDHASARRRFLREALISARLQHPAILPVYEAGRWPSGEPFLVMKRVRGRTLDELLTGARGLAERLALVPHVLTAADGVAYAHEQGVIHRDLKPANILVSQHGETLVIDWGLARMTGEPDADAPSLARIAAGDMTVAGAVVGTPRYMSPEQARGEPLGPRSDVYALGTVLYHVLAGAPPHDGLTGRELVAAVAEGAPLPLDRRVPPDLATIVAKALAPRAVDRYPSAAELASELRRYTTGELVRAHSYSTAALLARWARRNRAAVAVGAAMSVLVAVLAVVGVARIVGERDRAERERARAEAARDELLLSGARTLLERDPTRALELVARYAAESRSVDWREVETLAVDVRSRGAARYRIEDARQVAFSPDARHLTFVRGGRAAVLDLESGTLRVFEPPGRVAVGFSPSGAELAAAGTDPMLVVWNLATGARKERRGAAGQWLAYSTDGARLAVLAADGIHVLGSGSLEEERVLQHEDATSVEWLPRSALLYGSARTGPHWLWDVTSGERRDLPARIGKARPAAISSDGRWFAWGGAKDVELYEVATGARRALTGHTAWPNHCDFSPDAASLACVARDSTVRTWDVASGREQRTLPIGDWGVRVAYSPDGERLAFSDEDGAVSVLDLRTGDVHPLLGHVDKAMVRFSPDGAWLASFTFSGHVRVWPIRRDTAARRLHGREPGAEGHFAILPGARVAATSTDGWLVLWDLTRDTFERVRHPPLLGGGAAVSTDRRRLATGCPDATSGVWDLERRTAKVFLGHTAPVSCLAVAISGDGGLVATGAGNGEVRVWNAEDGASRLIGKHDGSIVTVAFSPDASKLVATAEGTAPRVWTVAGGEPLVLRGHEGVVYQARWAPDGRRLATVSADKRVIVWDAATGAARVFAGHRAPVYQLVFDRAGTMIATASDDRTARIWDLETGATRVLAHEAGVQGVALSPDDRTLAVSGNDGSVSLWDVASGRRFDVVRAPATEDIEFVQLDDAWVVAATSAVVRAWRYDRSVADGVRGRVWLDGLVVRDR